MRVSLKGRLARITAILLVLGYFTLFIGFGINTTQLGGDALSGHESGNHYYVAYKGVPREVTQAQWEENRLLTLSVFIGTPCAWGLIGILMLIYTREYAASLGIRRDAAVVSHLTSIRSSGDALVSQDIRGKLGNMRTMMHVTVHPMGVIIKVTLFPNIAILGSEIISIHTVKEKFRSTAIQINSNSPLRCPLIFYLSPQSQMMAAIGMISGHPMWNYTNE